MWAAALAAMRGGEIDGDRIVGEAAFDAWSCGTRVGESGGEDGEPRRAAMGGDCARERAGKCDAGVWNCCCGSSGEVPGAKERERREGVMGA